LPPAITAGAGQSASRVAAEVARAHAAGVYAYCVTACRQDDVRRAVAAALRAYAAAARAGITEPALEALLRRSTRFAVSGLIAAQSDRDTVCAEIPRLIAARDSDELSTADAERLRDHLTGCMRCQAIAERLARAESAMAAQPDGPAPPEVVVAIAEIFVAASDPRPTAPGAPVAEEAGEAHGDWIPPTLVPVAASTSRVLAPDRWMPKARGATLEPAASAATRAKAAAWHPASPEPSAAPPEPSPTSAEAAPAPPDRAASQPDADPIAGFFERRAPAVLSYCVEACPQGLIDDVARASFVDFVARVRSAADRDPDLDELLLRATRAAAAPRLRVAQPPSRLGARLLGRTEQPAGKLTCEAMPELLAAVANGELPGDEQPVRGHLEQCRTCQATAALMRRAEQEFVRVRSSDRRPVPPADRPS
jgi:hypothetical protein